MRPIDAMCFFIAGGFAWRALAAFMQWNTWSKAVESGNMHLTSDNPALTLPNLMTASWHEGISSLMFCAVFLLPALVPRAT